MKENAPCKGCSERHIACHDSCDRFKEWKERYHAQQQHLKENSDRFCIPSSVAREKIREHYIKFGDPHYKQGGNR